MGRCWCGSESFQEFNKDYALCLTCKSLVWKEQEYLYPEKDTNYYDAGYWLEHQHNLGLPDIYERMDSDWFDRIPYWIEKIMKYKLPPASSLEIGCSHGALIAGMHWLGYDAIGIELSSEIAKIAQKTYEVPVLTGPIEEQKFPPNSFDIIIMMDVIEHLSHPENTLSMCHSLLKHDGIMVIQTPKFPEMDYDALCSIQHPFLKMLIPQEHRFLFSPFGIKLLLQKTGFSYFAFEPAIFPYDMFLFASSQPLIPSSPESLKKAYHSSSTARLMKIIQSWSKTLQSNLIKINSLNQTINSLNQTINSLNQTIQKQNQQNQAYHSVIQALLSSNSYRFLRKLGRFNWLDKKIRQLQIGNEKTISQTTPLNPLDFHLKVAIDLTPVLPGGTNGGAKLLALNLVKIWSRELAPHWEYILLTSDNSHDELAWLDNINVKRICVNFTNKKQNGPKSGVLGKIKQIILKKFQRWLGDHRLQRLFAIYHRSIMKPKTKNIIENLEVDIVFCPFTAPFYYSPQKPIVLVVHDLQYLYYPQFFHPEDIYHTHRYFQQSTQVATRLICISEYTRQTVLENSLIEPDKVVTIPNNILNPLPSLNTEEEEKFLENLGLKKDEYLFYPANFWYHKNHSLLLIAFNMYLRQNPQSNLHLVFSGAPSSRMTLLQEATKRMGIDHRVHFVGYLDDKVFSAVLNGCRALIFPSLYEGFGVPLLEAMTHGKPVFCSNVTSIPEVVGDAAFTFDPHQVEEILLAIEQADQNVALLSSLSKKGIERASQWMSLKEWANAYLQVLLQSVKEIETRK